MTCDYLCPDKLPCPVCGNVHKRVSRISRKTKWVISVTVVIISITLFSLWARYYFQPEMRIQRHVRRYGWYPHNKFK